MFICSLLDCVIEMRLEKLLLVRLDWIGSDRGLDTIDRLDLITTYPIT